MTLVDARVKVVWITRGSRDRTGKLAVRLRRSRP